jgi:5'-3' exonuclease
LFGAEADDLAGYFCTVLPSEEYQILLLSEDSDWSQLLSRPNTAQGSYFKMCKAMPDLGKEHWLNYARFSEVNGLTPDQWFEKKMLTGDTADDVPGIAGLGDTGATRLMEKYGSLTNILDNKGSLDIPRLKKQAKDSLQDCDEVLKLGFKLMNLRWTKKQWIDILKQQGTYTLVNAQLEIDHKEEVNVEAFTELCYENGWIDFLDPQWIQPFCT